MEVERYHGQLVRIGDAVVYTHILPGGWSLEYVEFSEGEMPAYRGALMREGVQIVRALPTVIFFQE